jgi:hypothetical protein
VTRNYHYFPPALATGNLFPVNVLRACLGYKIAKQRNIKNCTNLVERKVENCRFPKQGK